MVFFRSLFVSLLVISNLSIITFADDKEPVEPEPEPILEAQLKVMVTRWGNKMFHAFWIGNKKQLVVNYTLNWVSFPEEVKQGFDLKEAETAEIISPELPKNCEIEKLSGYLADAEKTNSIINLKLKGKGCKGYQKKLRKQGIEIYFENVPFRKSEDGIEELIVKVQKLS